MQRVAVVGSGGSGKSTLARELGRRAGLPVVHLDHHYWRPAWEPTPDHEWDRVHEALVAGERWGIDGNYSRTIEPRLARADTVVLLDLSRWRCVARVLRRSLLGRAPDQAPGCPHRLDRDFLVWVWRYPARSRAKVLAAIAARGDAIRFVRLRSRRDARVPRPSRPRARGVMRVGLVLGAGGLTGQAFHAGVLAGLADELGWDARHASVIVGTSAGSGVGAYLRAGLPATDLAARLTGRPLGPEGRTLAARLGPVGNWRTPGGPRRLPRLSPTVIARALTRPGSVRPETLLALGLPPGRIPTETWAAALRPLFGTDWPVEPLWICAVRVGDARRVVFGRPGAPSTDVATAVAASSAIPGWFAPVAIDAHRYLDGGAHSPTNVDVLRDEDLDLVLVSSPMSTTWRRARVGVTDAARLHYRRRLNQELRGLVRRGVPVVAFEPSVEDRAVMGVNAMDPARGRAVVEQARATTRRRVREGRHADRLARLVA